MDLQEVGCECAEWFQTEQDGAQLWADAVYL